MNLECSLIVSNTVILLSHLERSTPIIELRTAWAAQFYCFFSKLCSLTHLQHMTSTDCIAEICFQQQPPCVQSEKKSVQPKIHMKSSMLLKAVTHNTCYGRVCLMALDVTGETASYSPTKQQVCYRCEDQGNR